MKKENTIKILEQKQVRSHWDEEKYRLILCLKKQKNLLLFSLLFPSNSKIKKLVNNKLQFVLKSCFSHFVLRKSNFAF